MHVKQADTWGVVAFVVLAFLHVIFFRIIPFPLGILTALVALLAGLIAFMLCVFRLARQRQRSSAIGLGTLVTAFACWYVLPTEDYSIYVRFKLEEPRYKAAVRGEKCTVPGGCMALAALPGFMVFPYEGLGVWAGVVYAPEGKIDRLLAQPDAVSSDVSCDTKPIEGHFFICGFY